MSDKLITIIKDINRIRAYRTIYGTDRSDNDAIWQDITAIYNTLSNAEQMQFNEYCD